MGIKYLVNEKFFNDWNERMAYVLGYFYADGSLEDAYYIRGKYIRVSSVDRYTILRIKKWLHSKHNIVKYKKNNPNSKTAYLLRIGNHKLYSVLTEFGLSPRKSLIVRFPSIPKKYFKDFLRGYFDGDGCVYLEMSSGKTRKFIIKKLSTIFTSGSMDFLVGLSLVIRQVLGLCKKVYNSQRSYQLRYGTNESIQLFKFLYQNTQSDLYLKRKFKVFRKYFNLRPSRVDNEIRKILKI